jgi:hypothetical protein
LITAGTKNEMITDATTETLNLNVLVRGAMEISFPQEETMTVAVLEEPISELRIQQVGKQAKSFSRLSLHVQKL